jgi:hypothetical protein
MEVFGDRADAADAEYAEVDPTRRYMRVCFPLVIYFLIDLACTLIYLIYANV